MNSDTGKLRAGACSIEVTPPYPMALVGMGGEFIGPDDKGYSYAGRRTAATQAHDPLLLTAICLESDEQTLFLLNADFLYTLAADQVTGAVSAECGVPPEAVYYTVTHNHNGPCRTDEYADFVAEKARLATRTAMDQSCTARVCAAQTHYDRMIVNRSAPWDPVDGAVEVVRFDAVETGQPIAFIWNYACHPCTLSSDFNQFSADYPGALRATVQDALGFAAPVAFLTGCSGNVQPVGVQRFRVPPGMYMNVPKGDMESVEWLGKILAEAGLLALQESSRTIASGETFARRFMIDTPVRFQVKSDELQERLARVEELIPHHADRAMEAFNVEIRRSLRRWLREGIAIADKREPRRAVEHAVLAIGDVAIVLTPLELAWEIGTAIKKDSPFSHTIISTTSLGYEGYLAQRQAYELPPEQAPYHARGPVDQAGFCYSADAASVLNEHIQARLREAHESVGSTADEDLVGPAGTPQKSGKAGFPRV